jgi:hypothetical protein
MRGRVLTATDPATVLQRLAETFAMLADTPPAPAFETVRSPA